MSKTIYTKNKVAISDVRGDLKEQILSKYETYVTLTLPHNTTPIFLKENVLLAMEEYADEIVSKRMELIDKASTKKR